MLFQIQCVIMKDFENIDAVKTGKFIKELRKAHNMKQDELGKKLFISRKSVSKWETGRACPSVDMMKRLSNVFGVSVNDLMAGEFISKTEQEDSEHKFVSIKKFKVIGIFSVAVILFLAFGLYEMYKNSSLSFKVYYEDENFFIDDGILVLDKQDSYLSFGQMKSYVDSIDISDLKCFLYLMDGNIIKELMTIKLNKTNRLLEDVRNEIMNHLDGNEIKDLYVKVFYFNEKEEEISFNLKLYVVRYPKSAVTSDRRVIGNIRKDSYIESHDKSLSELDETPDSIDIDFLFEMSKYKIEKCAKNETLTLGSDIYEINYDIDGDNIVFTSGESFSVQIDIGLKRVFVHDVNEFHYIIAADNVVRSHDIFPYYNLLHDIVVSFKQIC